MKLYLNPDLLFFMDLYKRTPKQRKMVDKDKIITALNLIEHMGVILAKEKLEFVRTDRSPEIDDLAKAFFNAQKSVLEEIKGTLT